MKTVYLLVLGLLLSSVAGCTGKTAYIAADHYDVGGSEAKEFHLNDGTRCVIYTGHAITCEWRQPVVLVQRPQ